MKDSSKSNFDSDAKRSAKPLKYAQKVTFTEPLPLKMGMSLEGVTVAFETYGTLNARRNNAVLICHALSGDSHVAVHDENDDPGWWDIMVGPGRPIDTDRFFVICPNVLGGCRGTTGPESINPGTGKPYGQSFPTITIEDMVEVERRLVHHLGVHTLMAVVGGSMGGHRALCWATRHRDEVQAVIAVATSPRLTSQALAFDVLGRNAILSDPNFRGGRYKEEGVRPETGLAIARMLGHITYLSREAMAAKFGANRLEPVDIPTEFEKRFSVGSYLAYQGEKFVERFDANSYLKLSLAMDLFDLGQTPEELARTLGTSTCKWLVISFTSDWLFPADQSRQMVECLIRNDRPVSYCNVTSNCGHDAFLLEQDFDRYGEMIREFLVNLENENKEDSTEEIDISAAAERLDYQLIVELSRPGDSVLDLGCGNGELLDLLKRRGHRKVMGVELDEHQIIECVRRGLNVIQADLNEGLPQFRDGQFDFVVLSRTLQVIRDVERVIDDVVRVGRRAIVTFPNFGYHKLRKMLSEEGRAPEAAGVLHHRWYNSPNIRVLTILDFEEFCNKKGITVHRRMTLDTESNREINNDPNLNADLAIFIISR